MQRHLKPLLLLLAFMMPAGLKAALPPLDAPLLEPEDAFRILVTFSDAHTLRIEYAIANGYYLYQPKFRFVTPTPGYTLGAPIFPPGETIHDEYFGEIETYRIQAIITIPVEITADANGAPLTLVATSQGCAEIGFCYYPYTHTVEIPPPAVAGSGK